MVSPKVRPPRPHIAPQNQHHSSVLAGAAPSTSSSPRVRKEAITQGADIIPKIHAMRVFNPPRRIADTSEGESMRNEIAALELLLRAYQENVLPERTAGARESLRP